MKITGNQIYAVLSSVLILLLCAALGKAIARGDRSQADADYMLAQRVAVLEVETYIKKRLPRQSVVEIRGVSELIVDAATEFRLSPLLVARVAIAESALNHKAVGDGGRSWGVMQLQRFWVSHIPFVEHERDLLRMDVGIRAGAFVLRHYADLCGEAEEAMLSCFNGGPKPNEQAKAYARRVAGGT
jgi:soluble lytic murein transglycosylase-like protein